MAEKRNDGKSRNKVIYSREGDGSDTEESNERMDPLTQDFQERLEIRRGYRSLIENLQKNKEDFINPQSESLNVALQETNELNARVKAPREGALDAAAILMISNLGRRKVEALKTDFIKFEPVEFAEKIKTVVRGGVTQAERDAPVTSSEWVELGRAVQKFFKKSPAFHYMAGSFEPGEPQRKQKERKEVVRNKDSQNDKATVVNKMKTFEEQGKNEATTEEVERVLQRLKECYAESDYNPVCYFEFVLNPHSFGQTVENMFYASFLVRDGLARIKLDDDKLPVIEPCVTDEKDQPSTGKKKEKNHQTIISITPQEWKELVSVYKIERPLIPTRKSDISEPREKKSKKT